MSEPDNQHRVTRDPQHCAGEWRIRGTRVTLRAILASLADGDRPEEVVQAFPSLCLEDVYAAILFAREGEANDLARPVVLRNAS